MMMVMRTVESNLESSLVLQIVLHTVEGSMGFSLWFLGLCWLVLSRE